MTESIGFLSMVCSSFMVASDGNGVAKRRPVAPKTRLARLSRENQKILQLTLDRDH